jgi:hypothetical protein
MHTEKPLPMGEAFLLLRCRAEVARVAIVMNTKSKGNKAESVILSEFVRRGIPVLIPFGDNEKYDLVVDLGGVFKSVQVKYGSYSNGCVVCDTRHRLGAKRIKYETYTGKVDFIAVWCEALDKSYLVPIADGDKTSFRLRVDKPKNNSCISTVVWASDYEISKVLQHT